MGPNWLGKEETVCLSAESGGALDRAVELLAEGALVAFPTDTVYGVGSHALHEGAVLRIFQAKERPLHLALPLLLPETAAVESVCQAVPEVAWRLADAFWPGALSLVLWKSGTVPDYVTGGQPTVAVRIPGDPLSRELCHRLGAPLAATSANRHGRPAPVTAQEVESELGGRLALILDGGPCPGGIPSTVLDLTCSPPAVLRSGPITREQLQRAAGLEID